MTSKQIQLACHPRFYKNPCGFGLRYSTPEMHRNFLKEVLQPTEFPVKDTILSPWLKEIGAIK